MAKTNATDYERNPSGIAVGLAITMAWQLAIVVVLPIVAGAALDTQLDSSPTCTVIGFSIATLSMIVVVRRTVQTLNNYMKPTPTTKETKQLDD